MTTLKQIQGFDVKTLASDPTEADSVGQLYYNSTDGVFKTVLNGGATIGVWSSGGSLNTPRDNTSSAGIQTSALSVGGWGGPPVGKLAQTENYNGTIWTEVNDLPVAKSHNRGCGSTTAAITIGGEAPGITNTVEEWDGTNWTSGGAYPTNITKLGVAGTQTAVITAFGYVGGSPGYTAISNTYNGSTWTSVASANTARNDVNGAVGIQTAALIAGGFVPPASNAVEEWNGSSWTEITEINTARWGGASAGQGTVTNALIFGGNTPPFSANTEFWNGTSWTETGDLATARADVGGAGSGGNSALAYGGATPGVTASTEEWNAPEFQIKTVTTS